MVNSPSLLLRPKRCLSRPTIYASRFLTGIKTRRTQFTSTFLLRCGHLSQQETISLENRAWMPWHRGRSALATLLQETGPNSCWQPPCLSRRGQFRPKQRSGSAMASWQPRPSLTAWRPRKKLPLTTGAAMTKQGKGEFSCLKTMQILRTQSSVQDLRLNLAWKTLTCAQRSTSLRILMAWVCLRPDLSSSPTRKMLTPRRRELKGNFSKLMRTNGSSTTSCHLFTKTLAYSSPTHTINTVALSKRRRCSCKRMGLCRHI